MIALTPYTPSMKIVPPCAVTGMPNKMTDAEYFAAKGLSQSNFKNFCPELGGSPAKFRAIETGAINDMEATDSMEEGTAIHQWYLEGVEPDWKKGCFKGESEKARDRKAMVTACVNLLRATADANHAFKSNREVPIFMTYKTGELLKGKLDGFDDAAVYDLKAVASTSFDLYHWNEAVYNYSYYFQAAWYLMLIDHHDPLRVPSEVTGKLETIERRFEFVVVEKKAVPNIAFRPLQKRAIELGKGIVERNMKLLADCRKFDYWPPAKELCDLPEWAYKKQEASNGN